MPNDFYTISYEAGTDGGIITVTATELNTEDSTSFNINFSDTDNNVSKTVDVQLENTSMESVRVEAQAATSTYPTLLLMTPSTKLAQRVKTLAKFQDNENYVGFGVEKPIDNIEFDKTVVTNIAASIETQIDLYESGQASESNIKETLEAFKVALTSLSSYNIELINHEVSQAKGLIPEIKFDDYKFSSEYNTFSLFLGNENLGSYNGNGNWEFKEEYDFLIAIATPDFETCSAQ